MRSSGRVRAEGPSTCQNRDGSPWDQGLTIINGGGSAVCWQPPRRALCHSHEVRAGWWADPRGVRPAGAGAAGSRGVDRGRGHRPGGGGPVPGDPDVGQPVAAGAGRRWPAGAGLEGPGWGALPAQPDPAGGAAGGARGRPGGVGLGGSVLDAAAHRRGRPRAVRRGLHPAGAGSAAAPAGVERAGARPARGRARRGGDQRLAGGGLGGDKRTAADRGAWGVFEDESGQGLRPPKGRSWGRRGRTPVVRVTAAISPRVSVAALLATKPGRRPRLIYRTHRGRRGGGRKGFTEADYAALLDAAHQQLGGTIVLVWDNLSTHTSKAMAELIAARPWLTVFRLPPYAHELNPVEQVWSHLKRSLANLTKHTIVELTALVKTRLKRMQYRPVLLAGFLASTGLEYGPFL